MAENINLLADKVRLKKKIEQEIRLLEKQKHSIQSEINILQRRVEAQQREVDELERPSVASFVATITFSKKATLEKEKQDVAQVTAKRQAAQDRLTQTRAEISLLEKQLKELADCEQQYALRLKENTADAQHRLEYLQLQHSDIMALINAGRKVQKYAFNIDKSLAQAKGWSYADILVGGRRGYLFAYDKYDNLDDANLQIPALKQAVSDFKTHLKKAIIYIDFDFSVSNLLKSADIFLDSLFVDGAVHGIITGYQWEVQDFESWMTKLMSAFEQEIENIETQIKDIKTTL